MNDQRRLPILILLLCILFVNTIWAQSSRYPSYFNTGKIVKPHLVDTNNYVLKRDGTTINGHHISVRGKYLTIDDTKIRLEEVKAYQQGGTYCYVMNKMPMGRFITGKLNVYANIMQVGGDVWYYYYIQRNDGTEPVLLHGIRDVDDFIKGCDEATQLMDMSLDDLKKKIAKDKSYLNKVIEVYNSDCR